MPGATFRWAGGLDAQGRDTTDPRKLATLLPLGGPKGSGLSFMIECLCSLTVGNPIIASALAAGGALDAPFLNGVAIALDLAVFGDRERILGEADRLARHVAACACRRRRAHLPSGRARRQHLAGANARRHSPAAGHVVAAPGLRQSARGGAAVMRATPQGGASVVPAHSASLRAFTPVFDGLWTRVNALMLGDPYSRGGGYGSPLSRGRRS